MNLISSLNSSFCVTESKKNNNISEFKDYLKKFDKKNVFQIHSTYSEKEIGEIESIKNKNKAINKSQNASPQNSFLEGSPKKNTFIHLFMKNANMIIQPIEEKNKNEEIQTPSINDVKRNFQKNFKNKKPNLNLDILEEGTKILRDSLNKLAGESQKKNESSADSKSNISQSIDFAIVETKKIDEDYKVEPLFRLNKR